MRCGIYGFLYGSAPLGFGRRAVVQPEHGAVFARCFRLQTGRAGTWRQPRAVCDVQLNPCTEQVPWACGSDSDAHSALSRFRDSVFDCLSSRGSRKSRDLAVMFHMKQFLFLPMFHVERSSGFSVRQTAARPIPPPACHSERQRRISRLQGQPILHVRRFFVAGSSE